MTRALCYDADTPDDWECLLAAARLLAEVGYQVIVEDSLARRGGHLWIIYTRLLNAAVAQRYSAYVAPMLGRMRMDYQGLQPFPSFGVLLYRRVIDRCGRKVMDQDEEDLLSLLATDLDRHFRQLVLLYQQRLYSFALRLIGSPQDAEDIVQETFLRSYHALKSYPALKIRAVRLRQWLYTITLNIFRNRQRKSEHQFISLDTSEGSPLLEIEDASSGPEEETYLHEWRRELEMQLASLSEHYRVAVTLYYFEDLSYVEIAELLNQPVGTVKARVHRALRQLHKALQTQTNGVR